MFQFRRFPSYTYWFSIWCYDVTHNGLLHSDICGSTLACNSPQLFAAYRVLHRLPMPRHPPCALISLTFVSHFRASSGLNYASHRLKLYEYFRIHRNCSFATLSLKSIWNYQLIFLIAFTLLLYSIFKIRFDEACFIMVGTNGLEPSTSRLSGVRSNHLSYAPIWFSPFPFTLWWRWGGSNSWPPACKAGALPAELHPQGCALSHSFLTSFEAPLTAR